MLDNRNPRPRPSRDVLNWLVFLAIVAALVVFLPPVVAHLMGVPQ